MELKLSIKRVLIDILSIKEQVLEAFKDNQEYEKLLLFLMEKDYYNDDELAIPTLKEIEKAINCKSQNLRKMLKNIYSDFFSYEKDYKMRFSTIEVNFNLEYFKRYAGFKCENLKYLPKVGDNITIPFLQATVGTDYFYVEDVRHIFQGDKQIIEIYLKGGYFNTYWYFRKHKAYEMGEIGLGASHSYYEYQLKEFLGLKR